MLERIRHTLLKKRRQQVAWWDLVERAEDHLRALDEDNEIQWRLSETRPTLDLPSGRILFTRPNGGIVTASVQCVGILGLGGTWSWTWEHPQIDRSLQAGARKLREYGQRHGYERLGSTLFPATEVEAWGLTAVACLQGRADGAYRLREPVGYLHVLVSNLSGARPQGIIERDLPELPSPAD